MKNKILDNENQLMFFHTERELHKTPNKAAVSYYIFLARNAARQKNNKHKLKKVKNVINMIL